MDGLSNLYIDKILSGNCNSFYGVYSANNIPTYILKKDNMTIVVNFANYGEIGTHFIVLKKTGNKFLFLDSLANKKDDLPDDLRRAIPRNTIFLLNQSIQHKHSTYCGFYCIYFALRMDQHYNVKLKPFKKRRKFENDSICITNILHMIKEKNKE